MKDEREDQVASEGLLVLKPRLACSCSLGQNLILNFFFQLCVCTRMHLCQSIYVEVRGQPPGVSSLLPLDGSQA